MASTWDDPNRIRRTRLHGIWFIPEHPDHAFIFRMEYKYFYDAQAQTPNRMVRVDLTDRHRDSPNIYVNHRRNMLWLDLLHAGAEDHNLFNKLFNADSGGVPNIDFNNTLYNTLITPNPFSDRVTVIPDSESDSDAGNNGAENERASIVGTIDV